MPSASAPRSATAPTPSTACSKCCARPWCGRYRGAPPSPPSAPSSEGWKARSAAATSRRSATPRVSTIKFLIPHQIFPDHQPRTVNARLDAFARQPENPRDLVDRQFFDIAQQDHLAIMIGQRLDGAGKIDANVFGREMREAPPLPRRPKRPPFPPTGATGEGRRGAPPQTATPK